MKDLFLIFVLLIGAAVALFVGLVVLQPAPPASPPFPSLEEGASPPGAPLLTEPEPESEPEGEEPPPLPMKVEGFSFVNFERTDPAFPGEEYSVTVFFAPEEGSPYEGAVESLGITRFQLETQTAGAEILETLLLLGEQTEEITVQDVPMTFFANEPVGLAGLAWQEGRQIYYILVSGVIGEEGEGSNLDVLKEAARVAAEAVLAQLRQRESGKAEGE